ncbi:alpha/beta fold hydrolase [Aneurinibacillus sp. REN35]|uniref:alpha/beta fold hydrolase n=1 Tax=Aneurinibacillus sp. REN35 TaxID=3237286 RepID=UPI0035285929
MDHVVKQTFSLDGYDMECGKTIPVTIGFETYGELNAARSNAILVCHFFSATSHAAGKYTPDDAEPGWWDGLIGPGKAIDTNQYFVLCADTLCNIQCKQPHVITTGPRSINPQTGERYGMSFPSFTYRDMAGIQHELIRSLGIEKLVAVVGPSAGGMQALNWAVHYPEMMDACIAVISGAQTPVLTSLAYLQAAIDAITLDSNWAEGAYEEEKEPQEGLHLALSLMNIAAYQYEWYDTSFPRDAAKDRVHSSPMQMPPFTHTFKKVVAERMSPYDASHYVYTARAAMMHDIARGFSSLDEALGRIQARVLMIPCTSDLLFPPQYSQETVDRINRLGGRASYYEFESPRGHMAGVFDTHLFAEPLAAFLQGVNDSK